MSIDKKTMERIDEITLTDYGFNEKGETKNWDVLVEDLILYYDDLQEKYDSLQERYTDRYFGDNEYDYYE